jgi:hypothetical protein
MRAAMVRRKRILLQRASKADFSLTTFSFATAVDLFELGDLLKSCHSCGQSLDRLLITERPEVETYKVIDRLRTHSIDDVDGKLKDENDKG